jgi:hypothetical protein
MRESSTHLGAPLIEEDRRLCPSRWIRGSGSGGHADDPRASVVAVRQWASSLTDTASFAGIRRHLGPFGNGCRNLPGPIEHEVRCSARPGRPVAARRICQTDWHLRRRVIGQPADWLSVAPIIKHHQIGQHGDTVPGDCGQPDPSTAIGRRALPDT